MKVRLKYYVKVSNPNLEFEVILNPGEDLIFVIDIQVKLLSVSSSPTLEVYKILNIKLLDTENVKDKPRCLGCIENQPNQLAHMDPPYGCLYEHNSLYDDIWLISF